MRARTLIPLLAILLAVEPAAAQCVADACIDTLALRAHTRFLADDALQGRGTGTAGERIAAEYIAAQLLRLGLEPLAGDDFLLPVPLAAARILPATRLTIDGVAFEHGRDFLVNTGSASAFRDFSGRALFVGSPQDAVTSLGSADVRGRVVVVAGPLGPAATALVPAWSRAGAAGVILLIADPDQFDLYARSRGPDRLYADAPVEDPVWQPDLPVLLGGAGVVRALLAGADLTAANGRPISLDAAVEAAIAVERRAVPTTNVAGIVAGGDPARRGEVVLYTAHYDHLGISIADDDGDTIYNGFSDNAAGVAMLLAIAENLRDAPPARSVAFLFLTGEERGLLGSSYFAAHPAIPLDRVAAVVNLDAGAPPAAPISWRIAGGTASSAGAAAADVADRLGWAATLSEPSPNSDYWPFLARGVPAIFVIPGAEWQDLTAVERDALRERWDRYHQAGDEYHALFPFAGLRRYAAYALEIGRALANAEQRPTIH